LNKKLLSVKISYNKTTICDRKNAHNSQNCGQKLWIMCISEVEEWNIIKIYMRQLL
jgi:hypothetical protein